MERNCKEIRKKIRFIFSKKFNSSIFKVTSIRQLNAFYDGILDHVSKKKCQCLSYYAAVRRQFLGPKG